MIVYVDIDETICDTPESRDYGLSTPINERIKKINALYDRGSYNYLLDCPRHRIWN